MVDGMSSSPGPRSVKISDDERAAGPPSGPAARASPSGRRGPST
jgi:hypothetical protein